MLAWGAADSISNLCKCCTGLFKALLCALAVTVRTSPSLPWWTSSTLANGHFPRDTLSSETTARYHLLVWEVFPCATYFSQSNDVSITAANPSSSGWVISAHKGISPIILLDSSKLSSVTSGKWLSDLPIARWAGLIGNGSLWSSLTAVSGLELMTPSILTSNVFSKWPHSMAKTSAACRLNASRNSTVVRLFVSYKWTIRDDARVNTNTLFSWRLSLLLQTTVQQSQFPRV